MKTIKNEILTIGVSSRALFNLEKEDQIYTEYGIENYRKYQMENENVLLEKGTAFHLVDNLLKLNTLTKEQVVEVVVMSKNSPETGIRMFNSIREYKLDITRAALTAGDPLTPDLIEAYNLDLFLSMDEKDVQAVIDSELCASAIIYKPPSNYNPTTHYVKIAFDADAVLFSESSEIRYKKEGIEAFHKFELENEEIPLSMGPFGKLLIKLFRIQSKLPSIIELSPIKLAIVTARNAPSHLRVIKTLRNWGVYVDEAYFLGGWKKKDKVLKAIGAHFFFDDQVIHLEPASKVVPTGKVPYNSKSVLKKIV